MREIKIGEKIIRVRATPLALLFYKQEFKTDAVGDFIGMLAPGLKIPKNIAAIKEDIGLDIDIRAILSKLDSIMLLQLIWAMAKADMSFGEKFPSFMVWVSELEGFDFSDPVMLSAVVEEAADGFFRGSGKKQQKY